MNTPDLPAVIEEAVPHQFDEAPVNAAQALAKFENRSGTLMTPAQAHIDAIANVLASAYAKSSTLKLSPEEVIKLKADFPDEAFKQGAAGKADLIYIEHAFLRDRFDEALGMGQWALLPTRPHWAEEFRTAKGESATRLYADCVLLVRGALVSRAIGDMVYYPNNPSQNYGDAAEGAVTASFRRCAKQFGVGLQAWKKDFCEGWWARRRAERAPRPGATNAPPAKDYTLKPDSTPPKKPLPAKDEPQEAIAQIVDVQEKKWQKDGKDKVAWLIKFNDGFSDLEAWCHSKSTSEFAGTAAGTKETFKVIYQTIPSKPGSFKLISLEQHKAGEPKRESPTEDGEMPLEFRA